MSDLYVKLAERIVEEMVRRGVDVCVALNYVSSKRDSISRLEPFVYQPSDIRIDPAAMV